MPGHTFQKVTRIRTRLADEVYDQLFSGIISGQIGPGDRLIQETIADEIDVSRTPVREALLRLEQEGIIRLAGRRGFVVCEVTEKEIRDSYQAREAIEGFAAGLVAAAGSEAALDHIATVISTESGHRQDRVEAGYRANRAVHRAIVEAAGNEFLLELFDAVWGRQVAVRLYAELFTETDLVLSFDHDHTALLQALREGDGQLATDVLVQHIRAGMELQVRALAARYARSAGNDLIEEASNGEV